MDRRLRLIVRVGVVLAVVAVAAQTGAYLTNAFVLGGRFWHLNVDLDGNFLAWVTSSITLAAAFAAFLAGTPFGSRILFVLAAVLVYFAFDDMYAMHERISLFAYDRLRLADVLPGPQLFWPLLLAPLLVFTFIALVRAARSVPPARTVLHVALGLLVFALVAEVASLWIDHEYGEPPSNFYAIEVVLEEGAELAAWIIVAAGLAAKGCHDFAKLGAAFAREPRRSQFGPAQWSESRRARSM